MLKEHISIVIKSELSESEKEEENGMLVEAWKEMHGEPLLCSNKSNNNLTNKNKD